jgi:regulator of protease activity HflC (stomatin/prohibitin superfamily)
MDQARQTVVERPGGTAGGLGMLLAMLVAQALMILALTAIIRSPWLFLLWGLAQVALIFCMTGLFLVSPNEGRVLQLLGRYVGTVKQPGFHWVNPFVLPRKRVSLRVHNFETSRLKVNDRDGNPVEIAAVVVWKVVDTAAAVFEVEDYGDFVRVQSEAALRTLATAYPYDAHDHEGLSLRGSTAQVAEQLRGELQQRLEQAGVRVLESRISHLAYAAEIAAAMLRRQQAAAVIAARQLLVEGAVSMVEMALRKLADNRVVELDEERKAAMVSNMLVVLCGDRDAQPVVNAGTIYQ